jgi:hypothetical protein
VSDPLPRLVLYGRQGCHLCDDARAIVDALLADRTARGLAAPQLEVRDIDADDELLRRYAFTIPVVALGDREVELATSPARLRRLFADVLDAGVTA